MPLRPLRDNTPAYTHGMSLQDAPPPTPTFSPTWSQRFATLGPAFHTELPAQGLPEPHWVARSPDCAAWLGWPADWWQAPDALRVFSGNALRPGMRPLASVYSGHQFGAWAGQLGDGRALLLGEVDTPAGLVEVQLKGAGRTPYSRMGDGRAVLRSSIREFLCSEAMAALGVPTSRALCLTGSALPVRRETPETAAVVTRVAPSFIRFGHFEHFSHHAQLGELRQLTDFVISHFYPHCAQAPDPVLALLEAVTRRTATLLAHWQSLGFCHGVMNTDNMSILGLTIDYGPFGFLDGFDPQHICNHTDSQGRYAFARQPQVAWWNLHALAQALLPLVGQGGGDEADIAAVQAALAPYSAQFSQDMTQLMRAKLGLSSAQDEDGELIDDWLRLLATEKVDYTIAMRRLSRWTPQNPTPLRDVFLDRQGVDAWAQRYQARLQAEHSDDTQRAAAMRRVNPKFVLRNHLAQTSIEQAQSGDFKGVDDLLTLLRHPFDEHPGHEAAAGFPPDWAQHLEVSCSS
jgi:serine/tyrosine/threonine adenylyltransferase